MNASLVREGLFTIGAEPGQDIALRVSRCPECSRVEFPFMRACPSCGTPTTEEDLPCEGELVGYTAVLHAPPGARVPVPFTVGVARFGADLCVMGLVDAPLADCAFAIPVRTVALVVDGDLLTYGFRPV